MQIEKQMEFARKISRESILSFEASKFLVSELLRNTSFEEMEKVYEVGGIYALAHLEKILHWFEESEDN